MSVPEPWARPVASGSVGPRRDTVPSSGRVRHGLVALAVAVGACTAPSAVVEPTTTSEPGASTTVTTTAVTISTTVANSLPPTTRPEDPSDRVLFTIPVGDGGVTYEGGFEDWEVDGPQALAVADDGSVWVADTGGRRLVRFSASGEVLVDVDTDAVAVAGLIDLAAVDDGVWGLEIVPAFDRHRILLFDLEGALVAEHELPDGLRLDDGLSGIAATPDGRLWIELEGGARVHEAFDDAGAFAHRPADGYRVGGVVVGPLPPTGGGRAVRFAVGDTVVERPVREQGGIAFEGATADSITLLVSDVAFGSDGTIDVRLEVLAVDLAGAVLATAGYPLGTVAAAAYVPNEFLSVASDGRLVALAPAADRLDVVELALTPTGDR